MKTLVYINENTENQEMEKVFEYLKENNLSNNLDIVKSSQSFDQYFDENLNGSVQPYKTITIYNLRYFSSLARAIEIMQKLVDQGVEVHFIKYQYVFASEVNINNLTSFIDRAGSDLAIASSARWPMHYKKPGRPKGSKNKSLMLDRFKAEIEQYLSQGFSYSAISGLIKCHPQTLKSWIDQKDTEQKMATTAV